jgi:hypothetical protein
MDNGGTIGADCLLFSKKRAAITVIFELRSQYVEECSQLAK